MEEVKKLPEYYLTPIVRLGDCKGGEYVYDNCAELAYVEKRKDGIIELHTNGFVHGCSNDTYVYPITLATKHIMDKMYALRQKYHNSHIMNSTFSHELSEALHTIMTLDPYDPEYKLKWKDFWDGLDNQYNEMLEHAKALHIV